MQPDFPQSLRELKATCSNCLEVTGSTSFLREKAVNMALLE